jgi:cytochrome P450/NADPH-cytochrome P450 reductase
LSNVLLNILIFMNLAGTCEELASSLAGQASAAGFAATTASLDSVLSKLAGPAGGVLPEAGGLLVISSTYNGTPPDNATEFARWLPKQPDGESIG